MAGAFGTKTTGEKHLSGLLAARSVARSGKAVHVRTRAAFFYGLGRSAPQAYNARMPRIPNINVNQAEKKARAKARAEAAAAEAAAKALLKKPRKTAKAAT